MSLKKADNLNEMEFIKNTRNRIKKHLFPKDVAVYSFGHSFKC